MINLNLSKNEIIKYLKSSFLENKTDLKIKNIKYENDEIKNLF